MFVARDSVFMEKEFISKKSSGRNVDLEEVREKQQTEQQEDMDHSMSETMYFEDLVPQEERTQNHIPEAGEL